MALKIDGGAGSQASQGAMLCPCRGVTRDEILARMEQGKLRSPEAVISVTHVGEGKCHGQADDGCELLSARARSELAVSQQVLQ